MSGYEPFAAELSVPFISATESPSSLTTHSPTAERYPNLEELLRSGGSYLIGDTKSLQGVAIASDAEIVYAALKRCEGESLDELHQRLDAVVGQVRRGEIEPVNEMPDQRFYVGRKRREGAKR